MFYEKGDTIVADKYDRMLENYFLGKYPNLIRIRELELDTESRDHVDENVGGGRAQHKYTNSVENRLARYDQDELLASLKSEEFLIRTWFSTTSPERQAVIRDKYRDRKTSWEQVAQANHISERTARMWRDDFKAVLMEWMK
mgnify:CR=1 FL=1